jgi:hypothetical protein
MSRLNPNLWLASLRAAHRRENSSLGEAAVTMEEIGIQEPLLSDRFLARVFHKRTVETVVARNRGGSPH